MQDKDCARIDSLLNLPLPRDGEDAAREAPTVPVEGLNRQSPANPPRHGTILLAEDNYINQMVTVRILEGHGHRVVVGANGRLALEIMGRQPVDLVLMDIQMPEMDGFQATKAIREQEAITGAHVPIVALTAHAMPGYRQKCLDAGMDDYLSKPFCSKDLLEVVDRALFGTGSDAQSHCQPLVDDYRQQHLALT